MKIKTVILIFCFIFIHSNPNNPASAQNFSLGSSNSSRFYSNNNYYNNNNPNNSTYWHRRRHNYHNNSCYNNNDIQSQNLSKTQRFLNNYIYPLFSNSYGNYNYYPNEFEQEYNTNSNLNYGTRVRIIE